MYSILAATAAIFLTIVLSDSKFIGMTWSCLLTVPPLSLSIWLFILSGEGITDAVDEKDFEKYLSFLVPYNFAVIFLHLGIFSTIVIKLSLDKILFSYCPFVGFIFFGVIFSLLTKRWWGHRGLIWLFFASKKDFENYIKELKGEMESESDRLLCFKLYMKLRKFFTEE
jgi:hypothetical protein